MRIDAPIFTGSFSLNGNTLQNLSAVSTTGSNTFVGNQTIQGYISASALTGSIDFINLTNVPTLVSGSSQVVSILSSLNTVTASFTPRITNLESKSASVDISISNINSVTASNIARLSNLETKSASVDISISNINSVTSSFSPRVSNLESKSASVDISITNINSITASNIARLSNLETKSASVDISISNINSFTSSENSKFTTLATYTGSNDTKWTSIGNLTGSYATTGSNTFKGTQIVSASMYVQGDFTVYGSSSIQYISASSVSIGTNIVTLNTANPAVRYAGISVQDSGSATGVTGSMLWDSTCNRWIYSNPSGVGYSGGIIMSGPRAATFGQETTLTCNYVAKSGGGDHLYDSCIIDDGTTVCVNANLIGMGTACFGNRINGVVGGTVYNTAGLWLQGSSTTDGIAIGGTGGYSKVIETYGGNLLLNYTTQNGVAICGNVGIGISSPCSILHVYGSNPSLIIQNSATATVGNTSNIIFRNLLSTGCIHFAGYIAGIQQSTSANTGDLSFNTYNNGSVNEGIRITAGGCIGIGTNTPCTMLHVQGQATIGCSTYRTRIDGSSSGTWISFGTLACTNLLGKIGTYESAYILDSNNGNISFRFAGTEKSYINSSGQACFSGIIIGTTCRAFGRNLTVQGDVVAYYSDSENITMGITAGTGAQSWGIQVCDTGDGGSALHLNARGGNVGINKGAGITADYPLDVTGNARVTGTATLGAISSGPINGGTLYTTTQRLTNTAGNYANMVHKVQGASGAFSQSVICVTLGGPGGWGYIINSGGTGLGTFQSGGGYTNGTINYSHGTAIGSGYTVSSPSDNVIRFVGAGGVHPFISIQMFGSLSQDFGDAHVCIYYS